MLRRVLVLVTTMVTAVLVASGVALAATVDCFMTDGTGATTCFGSSYPDTITGTEEADSIYGKQGADIIYGQSGDDHIYGDSNYDPGNPEANEEERLYGNLGDDYLYGAEGRDFLMGDSGADRLSHGLESPGEDRDEARGGWGNDKIWEGIAPVPEDLNNPTQPATIDLLVGEDGNDYILANNGAWADVYGGVGSDVIEASGDFAEDRIICGEDPDGKDVDMVYYDGPGWPKPDDVSADCELPIEKVLQDSFLPPTMPLPPPLPPPLP